MECQITFSLLSESLDGNIGDDWKYSVEAKVFNPELTGSGTIKVRKHQLRPGMRQTTPALGQSVSIPAGSCSSSPHVELVLHATEVDWLIDDKSSSALSVPVECPALGGRSIVVEPEISVQVHEMPRFLGGSAVLTIKVRLVTSCI